jgi:hypothetical protein
MGFSAAFTVELRHVVDARRDGISTITDASLARGAEMASCVAVLLKPSTRDQR